MSVEEELHEIVAKVIAWFTAPGTDLAEVDTVAGEAVTLIKDLVGTTQEKLLLDLSIARTAQRAAEGREQALEDTCAGLYRELAILHQERQDAP